MNRTGIKILTALFVATLDAMFFIVVYIKLLA